MAVAMQTMERGYGDVLSSVTGNPRRIRIGNGYSSSRIEFALRNTEPDRLSDIIDKANEKFKGIELSRENKDLLVNILGKSGGLYQNPDGSIDTGALESGIIAFEMGISLGILSKDSTDEKKDLTDRTEDLINLTVSAFLYHKYQTEVYPLVMDEDDYFHRVIPRNDDLRDVISNYDGRMKHFRVNAREVFRVFYDHERGRGNYFVEGKDCKKRKVVEILQLANAYVYCVNKEYDPEMAKENPEQVNDECFKFKRARMRLRYYPIIK